VLRSYGWSDEAVKKISEDLKEAGFAVVDEGRRVLWVSDERGLVLHCIWRSIYRGMMRILEARSLILLASFSSHFSILS